MTMELTTFSFPPAPFFLFPPFFLSPVRTLKTRPSSTIFIIP